MTLTALENSPDNADYQCYLVRLKRSTPQSAWRIQVEGVFTHETRQLRSLTELQEFFAVLLPSVEPPNLP